MSSLFQNPASEFCQGSSNLRGRRFSFNPPRPQDLLSHLRGGSSGQADSALADDVAIDLPVLPKGKRSYSTSIPLSPLSNVHMSGYSTNTHPPRYHEAFVSSSSRIGPSPSSSAAPTTFNSREASIIEFGTSDSSPKDEQIKRRLASAFFVYFLCGWGDGVTGTILPYFQAEFHLSYMTSSLLFVATTCGAIAGSLLVEPIMNRLGLFYLASTSPSIIPAIFCLPFTKNHRKPRGYSASQARYINLVLSCTVHASFFVLMGTRSGFPVMLFAYFAASFARAFLQASINAYLASGPKQASGYAFGLWSFGSVISPLVCQTLISAGTPWPRFYFGSLVVSAINMALVVYAFRPSRKEFAKERKDSLGTTASVNSSLPNHNSSDDPSDEMESKGSDSESTPDVTAPPPSPKSALRRALSMPSLWALALFASLYCGSETVTQGFIITYLLKTRHANPNTVGYVSSGFWGGITLARFLWGYYASRLNFLQRKFVVLGCFVVALVMHLLIWFVNSNIENAFSTSLIGLLYGSVWPAILGMANDLLPSDVLMISMVLISTSATMGIALFPFISGTIQSIKGVQTLTYVTVPMSVVLLGFWALLPSRAPSRVLAC